MAIYGTPITMGGGGGSNDTLPPLLDNFKATRLEGGIVPPTANTLAFKDIPDGAKIKLVKGSKISGTVTYGRPADLNHRIVFDSNDWTRKQFQLENNSKHTTIYDSDIDLWLNSTKASDWWGATNLPYAGDIDPYHTNSTPPDYANDEGFLYQLGITDEVLAQNFNDININATAKAKVALPWTAVVSDYIPYTFFDQMSYEIGARYIKLLGDSGDEITRIEVPRTRVADIEPFCGAIGMLFPMMEPKPDTKVALDVDGSYFMFEDVPRITLSADKMPASRANALAGAVWVYGEHEPKNVNDGTKISLTREEIVLPEGNTDIPPISYAEIERAKETTTWSAPEDGYYKFIGVAEGGRSGSAHRAVGTNYNVSGGSGGSGGIVVSVFKLKRGESVSLDVNSNVSFTYGSNVATATRGGSGGSSTITSSDKVQLGIYGKGGTASGGNLENINGKPGSPGNRYEGNKSGLIKGAKTVYEKYGSIGGYAKSTVKENDVVNMDIGSSAYIAVLKGSDSSSKTLNFTAKASKTIADLPSKTKVKLGRYGSKDLIWYTTKDNTQAQYLILTPEMTVRSPFAGMMLDNAEPSNPDSARQKNGNSRYIQSNSHQWLNSDKPANEWYTAQHEYDAPPDYANINGFLHEWTEAEKGALLSKSWQVEKAKIDGEGTETFFAKVVLPSDIEVGFGKGTEGEALDIFKSADDRTCNDKNWWLRSPYISYNDTSLIVYQYGSKYQYPVIQKYIVRPLVNIGPYTPVSENPDSDGCYTLILSKPIDPNAIVTKNILWDANKNFYARQFTYNSKKQYQTMLEGAIASPDIIPEGQEISKLPSKSKVKLGKVNGTALKWLVCRDSVDQSLRLILDASSVGVIGNKMYDNAKPSNSNADRRNSGNNRYIWSNIRQWLNSDKPANQWYTAQHTYDAAPDYTNVAGFLHEWTEKEISVLENASWVVTKHSIDGGGSESFQNRIVLPSTAEMGLESGTGGSKLDIFNNDGDRIVTGKYYWCRTPHPSFSSVARIVDTNGTITQRKAYYTDFGVRPLCKPIQTILVSAQPDSDGCYTLV